MLMKMYRPSYDDYDDNFVNITVNEHSSRANVNANESLNKLKDIKLKNVNHVIIVQLNINYLYFTEKLDFLKKH